MSEPAFIQPSIFLRWLFPGSFWRMKEDEKVVYLTFDDGPHPEVTEWVLAQLEYYQQQATFFCIGKNMQSFPIVLKKIENAGNAIGNHSFSHSKANLKSNTAFLDDVQKCHQLYPSKLFRPPYGKIRFSPYYKLRNQFKIIFWDILSYDYDEKYSGIECAQFVIKYLRKGAIITFHDSQKAFPRLKIALPIVLEYLQKNGYRSIPLHFN